MCRPLFSSAAALFSMVVVQLISFILADKSATHKQSTVINTVKELTPLVHTTLPV